MEVYKIVIVLAMVSTVHTVWTSSTAIAHTNDPPSENLQYLVIELTGHIKLSSRSTDRGGKQPSSDALNLLGLLTVLAHYHTLSRNQKRYFIAINEFTQNNANNHVSYYFILAHACLFKDIP